MSDIIKNPTEHREIDLLELLAHLGRNLKFFLTTILKSLIFLAVLAIKKVHLLVLFGVVGCTLGYLVYKTSPRYYSSNIILQPNGHTSTDMVDNINDLRNLSDENNYKELSKLFCLPDSLIQQIKDIHAYYIIDGNKDGIGDYVDFEDAVDLRDTLNIRLRNRVYITAEVYNNNAFKYVKEGIINYISNNPYLTKINELRKTQLLELIEQTDYEMAKLDSLQEAEILSKKNNLSKNQSQLMFITEKEQHLYYVDKIKMLRQNQGYKLDLELSITPCTLIKDFSTLNSEENPKSNYLTKYGFIFVIMGYVLLILLNFNKKFSFLNYIKTKD